VPPSLCRGPWLVAPPGKTLGTETLQRNGQLSPVLRAVLHEPERPERPERPEPRPAWVGAASPLTTPTRDCAGCCGAKSTHRDLKASKTQGSRCRFTGLSLLAFRLSSQKSGVSDTSQLVTTGQASIRCSRTRATKRREEADSDVGALPRCGLWSHPRLCTEHGGDPLACLTPSDSRRRGPFPANHAPRWCQTETNRGRDCLPPPPERSVQPMSPAQH